MRFALPSWLVIGAVVASAVIPASAQVPPPTRDRGGNDDNSSVPKYVDDADYDREPYYVDGVQYKPYASDGKKARAAATTAPAVQASVAAQSSSSESYAPGELHPFVPQTGSASTSSSSSAVTVAHTEASSSSAAPVPYTPKTRPRFGSAVIEALDKVTAESVRFEAPIGSAVRYKGLIYIVKACETTADDETQPDVMAYVQVRTSPVTATNTTAAVKSKEIFHGWMFASSPSLNPLQHPVYDAWVVSCRRPLA